MPLKEFANKKYYLDGLKNELVRLNTNIVHICSTFTDQQLNWCAKSGKWSILQHLEHIHLHNGSFIKKSFNSLKKVPSRPDQKVIEHPFRPCPSGSLYISTISAESQMKMRALPSFVPANDLDRMITLKRLRISTGKMFDLIEAAKTVNLNHVRLKVPGCSLLFYLGDVLEIIIQHTNRHLKQINDLVTLPGFPK